MQYKALTKKEIAQIKKSLTAQGVIFRHPSDEDYIGDYLSIIEKTFDEVIVRDWFESYFKIPVKRAKCELVVIIERKLDFIGNYVV